MADARTADSADDHTVVVGRLGPARGVQGQTFVAPATDDPADRFAPGARLHTDRPAQPTLVVADSSLAGGKLVVHFEGVDSRADAEALRGTVLSIDADARPELADPDDYYDTDLVGLRAVDPDGGVLGEIVGIAHGGAHDLLEVRIDARTHLVPFVAAIVPVVDLAAGTVTVDAPDGLFDL